MDIISQIIKLIKIPARSVLALHVNPDGDSVGSNLALAKILTHYQHNVNIYSHDPLPVIFKFLYGADRIIISNPCRINWNDYDIFWALDVTSPCRCSQELKNIAIKTINIDHHIQQQNGQFGNVSLADKNASSTSELLIKIIRQGNLYINDQIAQALLVGIISDTHYFLNSNTNKNVFENICYLMQYKVDYLDVICKLTRNMDFDDLQFISKALAKARINQKKHYVLIAVEYELWTSSGKSLEKKDYLENYIRSIKNTNFGIIITEKQKKTFNISFRARMPGFDVRQFAEKLGGGGHQAAAGATIKADNIDQVINLITKTF